ncbi:MAG: hypothetical protein QXN55_01035 [Candidatus Nitrosotenuis sp.]
MEDDTTAVVRFLPDRNTSNPLGFLVENLQHELIINGEKKRVPCLTMYGEKCPICELSRKYYNEKNEDLGYKYYKKKSYIGQVIVIESPIDNTDGELVKLIEFGPKIFKAIQAGFKSGDLEESPDDLKAGYNFRIKKTKSGKWSDYGTSTFSPKQTALDDSLIESLNLYDLSEYRTPYMDYDAIANMLLADQTGSTYEGSTGDSSNDIPDDSSSAPARTAAVSEAAPAPAAEQVNDKFDSSENTTSKASAVLERLKSRQAARKNAD